MVSRETIDIVKKYHEDVNLEDVKKKIEALKIDFVPAPFAKEADLSINAAMLIAKILKKSPIDIAKEIGDRIKDNKYISNYSIAKPGFINIKLSQECYIYALKFGSLTNDQDYIPQIGNGEMINLEYVSANPTGPLHIGHIRGAIYGSALSKLLERVGFNVTKDYYINDGGSQIKTLLKSALLRYKQAIEKTETIQIPESCYPGDYLIPIGKKLAEEFGEELLKIPEEEACTKIRKIVIDAMMEMIKKSMTLLGVRHDNFVSEAEIIRDGYVSEAIDNIKKKGLCYTAKLEKPKSVVSSSWIEEGEQEIFKSSLFGDDSDRVIIKSDGSFAYFAPDIGYHYYKYKRGANKMILIAGADHKGYVKRISAAVSAVSDGNANICVKLCELVNFIKDGKKVKSSKRNGNFLTAEDILDEIDLDVLKFIILSRKNDTVLDFDLDLVKVQSQENPVFYTKYAYSRCLSLLRGYKDIFHKDFSLSEEEEDGNWDLLQNKRVQRIILLCNMYPQVIERAIYSYEINVLANYLIELSGEFHSLWGATKEDGLKFLQKESESKTNKNMMFIVMIKKIISSCMSVIDIEAPDFM